MKTPVALLFLIISSVEASAQDAVSYVYDAAGNRMRREISVAKAARHVVQGKDGKASLGMRGGMNVCMVSGEDGGRIIIEAMSSKAPHRGIAMLHNIQGMTVASCDITSSRTVLSISNVPSGNYILSVTTDGKRHSWKVQKH